MSFIRILVYDMEFANGQVGGSVYSLGYTVIDEDFRVLVPKTDLLIDPACEWNEYVEKNILAYPKEEIDAAPTFPLVYDEIRALFASVDFAVGFSISNDIRALRSACARYELEPPEYAWLDVEKLCKQMEVHREAHGLEGYFRAWCPSKEVPANRHRSDVDAEMTMQLLHAICLFSHVDAAMMRDAYPECCGETVIPDVKRTRGQKRRASAEREKKKRPRRRTPFKKEKKKEEITS